MDLETRKIKNYAKTSRDIGGCNTLTKNEKNRHIQSFISQLFSKLKPENSIDDTISNDEIDIVYIIDRFEGNYAVCENRETKEMKNINIYELPEEINEGDVLRYKNNEYVLDTELKNEIEEKIKEKTKDIFED